MALTPCGCTQVLEAEPKTEFDICDNAGSPAFVEQGLTTIPQGADAMTVTFQTEKASANYVFVELAVENVVDANPKIIMAQDIERKRASFRVAFSGLADSTNYQLRWNVYVRSLT